MANTTAQTVSTLVESQLPDFIREDNPLFISFLQAYYEYLEQSNNSVFSGKTIDRSKNFLSYQDIDTTIDLFADKLYDEFMVQFPADMLADRVNILKNVKDFYRSKGTRKSYRFLFRAVFGKEIDFFYPKDQILRVSAGKWFVEQSIRVGSILVNGVSTSSLTSLQLFTNTKITGSTSLATAVVERVLLSYENGAAIYELFLSNKVGVFSSNETITTTDINGNTLQAAIISGVLVNITITSGGTRYNVGDPVYVQGGFSNSLGNVVTTAIVSGVTSGSITSVGVLNGGAGFRPGDSLFFTGGGGSNANAIVLNVVGTANNFFHPNTYNIAADTLITYANVTLNAANFGFPGYPFSNANTVMANAFTTFTYGITGPIGAISILSGGNNYISIPSVDAVGNTLIKSLGVLGRMNIVAGGTNYAANDVINFFNPGGTYGYGANAKVTSVNGSGSIQHVEFVPVPGFLTGGSGYDPTNLPTTTVTSVSGTGANIMVTATLAYGAPQVSLLPTTGDIGAITSIQILTQGQGYVTAPTINLSMSGDGTAQAYSNIVTGIYTYPGRYLDDSGFPSSFNFIQGKDYYQTWSYVIKVKQSIEQYRAFVKNLVHPAGYKLWGDFDYHDANIVPSHTTVNYTANTKQDAYYNVNTTSYSVTGSYLYKNTAMTGIANASTGTISFWFNLASNPQNNVPQHIYSSGNTSSYVMFSVYVANTGVTNASNKYIEVRGKDVTGNVILRLQSNTADVIQLNTWTHVVSSWDLTNSANWLYVSNVLSRNAITANAGAIYYNTANSAVGAVSNGAQRFDGQLTEVWFDTRYVNLSNVTNRQKYINSGLYPVKLGSDGSTPTGLQPVVYLRANAASWNVNYGSGGNFSQNASFVVGNSSPRPV